MMQMILDHEPSKAEAQCKERRLGHRLSPYGKNSHLYWIILLYINKQLIQDQFRYIKVDRIIEMINGNIHSTELQVVKILQSKVAYYSDMKHALASQWRVSFALVVHLDETWQQRQRFAHLYHNLWYCWLNSINHFWKINNKTK